MEPVIKSYYSADINDVQSFIPEKTDCFGFSLQLMVGPPETEGSESFEIFVCTTKWFENELLKEKHIINGRHYLFMDKYDFLGLERYLKELISNCSGNNWNECVLKLSRYGHWEFEDYKEWRA